MITKSGSRDNFTTKTKRILGDRVGYRCSCPTCRRLTIGPAKDISAPLLVAEAAHISAASQGGPRFSENLTPDERRATENGIWLCATCHTMIDKDRNHFTDTLLREWKQTAEDLARREVEGEVVFGGYTDSKTAAEQHFRAQLDQFTVAHPEVGQPKASKEPIPVVWVQIVPAATLKGLVKLSPAEMRPLLAQIKPVICSSWGTAVSRFGVHVYGNGYSGENDTQNTQSLFQLFKDGSLAIGFQMFTRDGGGIGMDYSKSKLIPWVAFEDRLFAAIKQGMDVLHNLQLSPVAYVRLVVSTIKGYYFAFNPGNWIQHQPAETDTITTTVSLIANFDLPSTEIARPLLEEFWQHFAVWHSPSYDANGAFIRHSR